MSTTLEAFSELLKRARSPADVFGALVGDAAHQQRSLEKDYRCKVKIVHPDHNPPETSELAKEVFQTLTTWFTLAQEQIRKGRYGAAPPASPVTVRAKKREYVVGEQVATGDLCNLYDCIYAERGKTQKAIFKVTRDIRDNDLAQNEVRILKMLQESPGYPDFQSFVPRLVDSFAYRDTSSTSARQANILSFADGRLISLNEVRSHYPEGVDVRDMAWMWRRLLATLFNIHNCGVIHGAVLPTHILIEPEYHGLVLIDWSYAVLRQAKADERIQALSTEYESWYPEDVLTKSRPLPGLDIYMGAMVMVWIVGGDPLKGEMPDSIPKPLQAFFKGCLLKGPRARPQDAYQLLKEYDVLLNRLYGKRTFRPFDIPPRG